jgi:hypothetical protein
VAATLSYDPAVGVAILFGGLSTVPLGDTWSWDGTTWSEEAPPTSPPARSDAASGFDLTTEQVVLFGGSDYPDLLGDTWTYGPLLSVPSAPTGVVAQAGNQQATISFTAPTDTGGSTITTYTVTAEDVTNAARGGQTAEGQGSPLVVTGLTNGDAYEFVVTATNSVGTGPGSPPSSSVVPNGLAITTLALPSATIGTPYSASVVATGGNPPYRWRVVSGALPRGLRLDHSTGGIYGIPSKRSTSASFTLEVRDAKTLRSRGHPSTRNSATATLSIIVGSQP